MSHLKISNLAKSFGDVEVLKNINLDIESGEFIVFVGPSGCGKSTLLRCISGLEEISAGTIELDDKVINNVSPSAREIAMVFQTYALYPHMTVEQNMSYALRIQKTPKNEIKKKVNNAAQKLHLQDHLDRYPKTLSGGQRQRVAIGRAIVRNPKVFLFDEPLSNLDASLRVQMRIEIGDLHKSLSTTTMIYVTHDQVEAMTMADRIVVLRDGVIEQIGTPMELYESPNSLFVAQFIGSPKMNILEGKHAEGFDGHHVGIRPEHLEIVKSGGRWSGKIIYSENLGSDSFIYLDIGCKLPLVVRQVGKLTYHSDSEISVSPIAEHVHLFDEKGNAIKLGV